MSDKIAKCAKRKCGWIGRESEMRNVVVETTPLKVTELHCPRCDGNEFFYKLKDGEVEKPKSGAQLIALERDRQLKIEGWTPEHDDKHKKHELALAASSYIAVVASPDEDGDEHGKVRPCWDWPWSKKWWKPSDDPVRNLVKAGALIAAEIDRLQRAQAKEVQS